MPVKARAPGKAVEEARLRREARAVVSQIRIEWFIEDVLNKVGASMAKRVRIATEYLHSKITLNISKAVVVGTGPRSGRRVVIERSKRGEFPRADTTQLMKTLIRDVKQDEAGQWSGYVGTPLSYGLILETDEDLDRKFLVRTLNEERDKIAQILDGPLEVT